MQKLKLSVIESEISLQPRAEFRLDWIEEYATDLENGAVFPPIVVFFDGTSYWLADGFHRLRAHQRAGLDTIQADVRGGTQRDALLHSVGANAQHGHRRTNEDKRHAIDIMLRDPEWSQWSDNDIAGRVGVDHKTVAKRREAISGNSQDVRRVTRGDTTYEMNTTKIGHKAAMQPPVDEDDEDLEDEADEDAEQEAENARWRVINALRRIADLPPPATAINAFLTRSDSPDDLAETMEKAQAWLKDFLSHWERVKEEAAGGG
jgi:ParB-like chromosome segregation protein Spo0J